MALIKCPECNSEVSDKAPQCVKCGFPLRQSAGEGNGPAVSQGRDDDSEEFDVNEFADLNPPSFWKRHLWKFIRYGFVAALVIVGLTFLEKNQALALSLVLIGVIVACWSKGRVWKVIRYGFVAFFAIMAWHFFGREEVLAAGSLAIGAIFVCWGRGNTWWKWGFVLICAWVFWRGYTGAAFDPDEETNKVIFWGAAVLGGIVGLWGMGFGTAFLQGCLSGDGGGGGGGGGGGSAPKSIAVAKQSGSSVYCYDARGSQLFSLFGQLHSYTGSTVTVLRGSSLYVYDVNGSQISSHFA